MTVVLCILRNEKDLAKENISFIESSDICRCIYRPNDEDSNANDTYYLLYTEETGRERFQVLEERTTISKVDEVHDDTTNEPGTEQKSFPCDESSPLDQNSIKCIKSNEDYLMNHDNFSNIDYKFTNVAYKIDTGDKGVRSMADVFEFSDKENSEVPKVYKKYRSTKRTEKGSGTNELAEEVIVESSEDKMTSEDEYKPKKSRKTNNKVHYTLNFGIVSIMTEEVADYDGKDYYLSDDFLRNAVDQILRDELR